ncbi:hypothetical protein Tco_0986960 [Tanacetum coccineum]
MLSAWQIKRGRVTKIPQSSGPPIKVGDEAVHKELGDRMESAATTASSLKAEQDNAQTRFEAASKSPMMHLSQEFWRTATASTSANGEVELTATIDGQVKTITEASLRRHLKLEDNGGITTLPNTNIFEQLALMGYVTDSEKLTFQKEPSFSPQHTPITALSTSQPSNIHTTPVTEEAASMPYESPLKSVHLLGRNKGSVSLNELTVLCTSLSKKVEGLESELKQTQQTYSTALTKLIKKVNKLEQTIKTTKARRRAKIVISEDEDVEEDPSKQGRSLIEELDLDARISLVPLHDAEIQEDADIQIRTSDDTEVLLEEEEPTELVEDPGSGEKGETQVSTAKVQISTASATPEVSTAAQNLGYVRRSAKKAKDKGKGIMTEPKPKKKTKLQQRQERAGL